MNFLHSRLTFDFDSIENFSESDIPSVIYKYFDTSKDRDNFLKGNLWFSGPSQNRFFTGVADALEYRNMFGSYMHEYALSCSTEILDYNKPNIKIINPLSFIQEIMMSICNRNRELSHQISWIPKNLLQPHAKLIPVINSIKKFPIQIDEEVILHVVGVGIRRLTYVDKITAASKGFKYDSVEIAKNARNQNMDFQDENEVRLHINTGDFLGEYSGCSLMHLVQYLKLFCPGVSKYCIPI